MGHVCLLLSFCSVSSGSDSDSDDSERSTADIDLSCLMRNDVNNVKEASADSNDSSAGEDDFNPFGNSGSDDEGIYMITKFIYFIIVSCTKLSRNIITPCVLGPSLRSRCMMVIRVQEGMWSSCVSFTRPHLSCTHITFMHVRCRLP